MNGVEHEHSCDRCGVRREQLRNEATFLFCVDRAACDARRCDRDLARYEDVIAPVDGYPDVRVHGPRNQVNALLDALVTAQAPPKGTER